MRCFTYLMFGLVILFSQTSCSFLEYKLYDITPKVQISELPYDNKLNSRQLKEILVNVSEEMRDNFLPYTEDNKFYIIDVEFDPQTNIWTFHVSMPDDDNIETENVDKLLNTPKEQEFLLYKLTDPLCDNRPISKLVRALLVKEGGMVRYSLYYKNDHKLDFDITKDSYCKKRMGSKKRNHTSIDYNPL